VLRELPSKTRQILELPSDGLEGALEDEWAAFNDHEKVLDRLRVSVQLSKASDNDADYMVAVAALKDGVAASFRDMSLARPARGQGQAPGCHRPHQ
jgi:hypothetical protein